VLGGGRSAFCLSFRWIDAKLPPAGVIGVWGPWVSFVDGDAVDWNRVWAEVDGGLKDHAES